MGDLQVIKTSNSDWLKEVGRKYKAKTGFELIDDAGLGVNPAEQSLPGMGRVASVSMAQWVQLGGVFGIGATGVGLIALAFIDPEPTSKLGLIVGTGAFLAITGGLGGLHVLTGIKPASVEMKRDGVFIVRFS